jgi:hypothetical protein
MRFTIFHCGNSGESEYHAEDLPTALRRADAIISESSPGTIVYIRDRDTGHEYSEPEIRDMAQDLDNTQKP